MQICIQRLLGRDIYNDREKLAWSIILATKGLEGFIDQLLASEEYLNNFGDDTLPYQRRRILPQRDLGALPFARMPRYGADYRNKLKKIGYFSNKSKVVASGDGLNGVFFFIAVFILITLIAWGITHL